MSLERTFKGSVKSENVFKETVHLEDKSRLDWFVYWEWSIHMLRERQKAVEHYKKVSPRALAMAALEESDKRSVLPFPIVTSREHGWLSARKEFTLEVFGPFYAKHPAYSPETSSSIFSSSSGEI